MRKTLHFLLES